MKIDLSFDALSSLLAFVQAVLLGFFFLTYKSGNRSANIFLGIFLLSYYAGDFYNFIGASGIIQSVPDLAFFPSLFLFWLGPSIYFYIKSVVEGKLQHDRKTIMAYLPGIFELLAGLILFAQTVETKSILFESETFWLVHHIYSLIAGLHAVFYVALSIRIYSQYKIIQSNETSDAVLKQILWLKYFLYYWLVNFLIWVVAKIVILVVGSISDIDLNTPFGYINAVLNFSSLFVIYAISYFTLKRLNTVSGFFQTKKYSSSKLDDKKEAEYYAALLHLFATDKSYLKADYKIADLANQLSINTKYLSQIINNNFKGSFIELINTYRVEEVKRKLKDKANDHLTIAAIAEECGFQAKSTFTRVFRAQTGMLPKDFKAQS